MLFVFETLEKEVTLKDNYFFSVPQISKIFILPFENNFFTV